jgi:hypothetical protein
MKRFEYKLPNNCELSFLKSPDCQDFRWINFSESNVSKRDRKNNFFVIEFQKEYGLITEKEEYLLPADLKWILEFSITSPARGPGGCVLNLFYRELYSLPKNIGLTTFIFTISSTYSSSNDLLEIAKKLSSDLKFKLLIHDYGSDH